MSQLFYTLWRRSGIDMFFIRLDFRFGNRLSGLYANWRLLCSFVLSLSRYVCVFFRTMAVHRQVKLLFSICFEQFMKYNPQDKHVSDTIANGQTCVCCVCVSVVTCNFDSCFLILDDGFMVKIKKRHRQSACKRT